MIGRLRYRTIFQRIRCGIVQGKDGGVSVTQVVGDDQLEDRFVGVKCAVSACHVARTVQVGYLDQVSSKAVT